MSSVAASPLRWQPAEQRSARRFPGAAIRLRRPAASPVARLSTAGGVEIIAGGTEIGGAISSGGTMNVSSGGIASGTQINSNGLEVDFSGGTDFGATVSEGGNLFLSGGTSISASLVGSDTSGGGGRETVSSGGTALGTTLSASAQLRVSSGGVAISTTEIGTERAMRAGQGGSDSRDFGMSARYFVRC